MKLSSKVSGADLVTLCCAVAIVVAFLLLPWLTLADSDATGLGLLATIDAESQADISMLWLILLAAVIGSLAAFWGLFVPRGGRVASAGALGAGLIGLAYYVVYFIESIQSPTSRSGTLNVAVWVTLFASIGLVIQALMPRAEDEPLGVGTAPAPQTERRQPAFVAVMRAILVILMGLSFVLIGQQADRSIYQVGLLLLIVSTLLQIAFGNIPPEFPYRRSLIMLVVIQAIILTIFLAGINLVPSLIRLGRG